jgi:hypothetical protein
MWPRGGSGVSRLCYGELSPNQVLDMTSLVPEELEQLVPPFEAEFQEHMSKWRIDRKPRTKRSFAVYKNCPLPTAHERLFFLLVYLKTLPIQASHGCMFGLPQGKAITPITNLERRNRDA